MSNLLRESEFSYNLDKDDKFIGIDWTMKTEDADIQKFSWYKFVQAVSFTNISQKMQVKYIC